MPDLQRGIYGRWNRRGNSNLPHAIVYSSYGWTGRLKWPKAEVPICLILKNILLSFLIYYNWPLNKSRFIFKA